MTKSTWERERATHDILFYIFNIYEMKYIYVINYDAPVCSGCGILADWESYGIWRISLQRLTTDKEKWLCVCRRRRKNSSNDNQPNNNKQKNYKEIKITIGGQEVNNEKKNGNWEENVRFSFHTELLVLRRHHSSRMHIHKWNEWMNEQLLLSRIIRHNESPFMSNKW